MLLRSGIGASGSHGDYHCGYGIDSDRRMNMEAFWTAMTQAFWWAILVVAGTSLIFMLAFLFWAICNEIDKEKLAKTKETR